MAGETTFGRRRAGAPQPMGAPRRSPPAPPPSVDDLSPAAEAFRAALKSGRPNDDPDFSDWMRRQQGRRAVAWGLGLALMVPGLVGFVIDLPWPVSSGLEAFGLIAAWWLRRERRRHLKAVATWEEPA